MRRAKVRYPPQILLKMKHRFPASGITPLEAFEDQRVENRDAQCECNTYKNTSPPQKVLFYSHIIHVRVHVPMDVQIVNLFEFSNF